MIADFLNSEWVFVAAGVIIIASLIIEATIANREQVKEWWREYLVDDAPDE